MIRTESGGNITSEPHQRVKMKSHVRACTGVIRSLYELRRSERVSCSIRDRLILPNQSPRWRNEMFGAHSLVDGIIGLLNPVWG